MVFKISSLGQYESEYKKSIDNPNGFWAEIAQNFVWDKNWNNVLDCDLDSADVSWFEGAELNITNSCLDRHLEKKSDDIAIIWEANNPKNSSRKITYRELYEQVNQFSNLLVNRGVAKGDRVCIYMPMIPEAMVAMLACARVGAVHCVVFAGFSSQALEGRIEDSNAKVVITADYLYRGDKTVNILDVVDGATKNCDSIKDIIVYKRSDRDIKITKNLVIWQDEIVKHNKDFKAVSVSSKDPLFILYTSGSTGKPKGIVHGAGGYMVYAGYSFANVFNYQENDLFFCTADVGWITGHSYLTYGPLLNGAQVLMFEGVPTYPTPSRFWEIIAKHKVNIFYTAPTAIRALMQKGDKYIDNFDLTSLKTLGSVGEPINEEAWHWYNNKVGKGRCDIVDTWWQTETGGIMISSLAGATSSPPSFAGKPLPGIKPILLYDNGKEVVESGVTGNLCFSQPWPSMLKTIWGDHEKCYDTYYKNYPGYYFAGDGAFRAKNGDYRIIGRIDDVINSSGHRLGTAEIENSINTHEIVSESAVISYPHKIKGDGICAFVIVKTAKKGIEEEILKLVEDQISAIAKPDKIYIVSDLPKTRSGKIMRRILKKLIVQDDDLGDISTLVNPDIVETLRKII